MIEAIALEFGKVFFEMDQDGLNDRIQSRVAIVLASLIVRADGKNWKES